MGTRTSALGMTSSSPMGTTRSCGVNVLLLQAGLRLCACVGYGMQGVVMRRTFVLGGLAALLPLVARAQQVAIGDPPEAFIPLPSPTPLPVPAPHKRKKHHRRHS